MKCYSSLPRAPDLEPHQQMCHVQDTPERRGGYPSVGDKVSLLVWFYGISTIVGYLMLNLVFIYIYIYLNKGK